MSIVTFRRRLRRLVSLLLSIGPSHPGRRVRPGRPYRKHQLWHCDWGTPSTEE